jgi:uncharacterized membrane protein
MREKDGRQGCVTRAWAQIRAQVRAFGLAQRLGVILVLSAGWLGGSSAAAAEAASLKGIWLTTDFPVLAVRAGEQGVLKLKLQNYNAPPERLSLKVDEVPAGWKAAFLGGGMPVNAAVPGANESVALQLRVEVPAGASAGSRRLVVSAYGPGVDAQLPVEVRVGEGLPPKLAIKAKLPSLRGTAKTSFEFQFSVQNESGQDLLVQLAARAPQAFQSSFTESFGAQELSSIPIEAGQSKDLKVKVQPPDNLAAGRYELAIGASASGAEATQELSMEVTGQPRLQISTEDGRLSAEAQAGRPSPLTVVLSNAGSAPANNIELTATPPGGWKIDLQPSTVPVLAPGAKLPVQASFTPSAKAVAGDYMATLRASSEAASTTADFRVTVTTSTVWGIAGVLIIAVALLVGVGAVARFGRR